MTTFTLLKTRQILIYNLCCFFILFVSSNIFSQTVTDIDGNTYQTVIIGKQVWMKENLKTTRYQNGDPIPTGLSDAMWTNTISGAYATCNNDPTNDALYGKIYNGYATADKRNVCPIGWHVPSLAEFDTLANFLGGYNVAGGKIKEAGLVHWQSPNTGATNSSSFTALPAGNRLDDGTYYNFGEATSFMTTALTYDSVYNIEEDREVQWNEASLNLGGDIATSGGSVRCIQNASIVIVTQPKIYTSSSSLNAGQAQIITGSGFTNNGTIDLYVKNSQGDIIPNNNSFTYLANGAFSYQLPITSAMPGGEYEVYATDVTTGVTTATIKFLVNNSTTQRKLWITAPVNSGNYSVNQAITISWGDYITSSQVTGQTGLVTKRYKIEYSNDNGSTWNTISNNFIKDVQANQIDYFNTNYTFDNAGTYEIRLTDIDNPLDFNTSSSITVTATIIGGFSASLEWDKSSPTPAFVDHPVGLAADGVSRILIKLNRNTGITTPVKSVNAQILSSSDNSSGTSMLGKIKLALQSVDSYSLEGNAADSTSTSYTFPSSNTNQAIYFWLVAPDDFIQQANSQAAERTIKLTCTITYNDNTTEFKTIDNIRIVRPPLMMVHGINSDASAFDKTKYDVGTGERLFKYSGGEDGLFKVYYPVNLPSYSSFSNNAQNLLAESGLNSFQYVLDKLHYLGFAGNRVDYVAHSMGGSLARTIINEFHRQYAPQPGDPRKFQNYDSGFIHKLITLNTPHNGSPLADFIEDQFTNIAGDALLQLLAFIGGNHLSGFFVKSSSGLTYIPSDAVKDLQAINGGIRFKETFVKNHLIGGDLDRYNVPDADLLVSLNGDSQTKLILSLCNMLLPDEVEGADGIIDALNAYISLHYTYPNFLSNSDLVVPVSSEFASPLTDFNEDQIPEVENTNAISTETNSYGVDRNHILITDDLAIGTEVMHLLNSPVNSGLFANSIAANPNPGGTTYKTNSIQGNDSTINYVDTSYIKITNPQSSSTVYVDSTLNIAIHVSDTTNLQKIQLVFQGQYYESVSKITDQVFNVQVLPTAIGKMTIVVNGIYDSSGYTINHTDTATVLVAAADSLEGFYATPKTQNLNPHQIFNPVYNAVYSTYIGNLAQDIDSLHFSIADANVVKYIDSLHEFVAQDTGTTYIVYNYKGFADTGYVYITLSAPQTVLAVALNSFDVSSKDCKTALLHWKTSAVTNNYGFDIEQSRDGIHFTKIAFIKSRNDAGFNYNYTIDSLQQGHYYYRLKQIDFDGKYTYSSVQTINLNCANKNIISLYPNPAINNITLISSISGAAVINVMDSHGKTVRTLKTNFASGSTQDISITNLSAGVYFVQVKIGDEIQNLKFVKE